jgi:hypothetical protein
VNPAGTAPGTPQSSTKTRGEMPAAATETRLESVRHAAGELYGRRVAAIRRRGLDLDAAHDAVAAGTVRALSTGSLPEVPTLAWFVAVDRSAALDAGRSQARARAAAGAMAAYYIQHERAALPAKGKGISPEADPDDDTGVDSHDNDGVPEYIHLLSDHASGAEPRYLPFEPPHEMPTRPDEVAEPRLALEHRRVLAREAREQLSKLAAQAKVSDEALALIGRRYGAVAPVAWSSVAKAVGARKEQVRRRVQLTLDALREAAGESVDVVLLLQRAHLVPPEEVIPAMSDLSTMPDEELIQHATHILRDRVARLLMMVLDLSPAAEPHVRDWANAVNLKNVIEFDADDTPDVNFVVVPLFLLDYAMAMIRRDYGLAAEQARTETDQIDPMIREDWPKVFSGGGEVEYRTYSVEVAAGEAQFDVVGQAMDYIEAWIARRRA